MLHLLVWMAIMTSVVIIADRKWSEIQQYNVTALICSLACDSCAYIEKHDLATRHQKDFWGTNVWYFVIREHFSWLGCKVECFDIKKSYYDVWSRAKVKSFDNVWISQSELEPFALQTLKGNGREVWSLKNDNVRSKQRQKHSDDWLCLQV